MRFLTLSSLLLFLFSVTFAQERVMTLDDVFSLHRVANPVVSPDGKWVAYTVSAKDLEKDKSETRIWMAPTAGGKAIPMTAKGYSANQPAWSPDGQFLSFLATKGEGKSQVWTLNRLGGEAEQLTKVPQGVNGYVWSPDSKRLLLLIKDKDPNEPKEKGEKAKPQPQVINRLQFKRDYTGYLDERRTHIYTFTPGDTSITQITSGDFDDSQAGWSPDGKLIAFVSNRSDNPDANSNTDIWIVSADNEDKGQTLIQVTQNEGSDNNPSWSPDGKWLTYTTVTEPDLIWYATNKLAMASADGKEVKVLSEDLDRNVYNPMFAADGKSIYFVLEDSGEQHLGRYQLDSKKIDRPISGAFSLGAFSFSPDGKTLASLISKPHLPEEVFVGVGAEPKQITFTNETLLKSIKWAEVENVQFASKDGTQIEGFFYKPPAFQPNFKYPTLLRIHGGPVSQYDLGFNQEAQLLAAQGYLVIMVNPRGSSGYGQDFSRAIWADWGNKDFEDVVAGVDHAIAKGYADPERLGVGGWSYGGILTNYVITQTDRFKGAISGASEVLFRSNYGHDHYQLEWEKELGLPWKNAEAWERISPFNKVENVVTPTLIMGGAVDWNVPINNSEQLYQALKRLGKETQLIVYPDEHHGIQRPSFQKDRYERYINWYDRLVKRNQVKP